MSDEAQKQLLLQFFKAVGQAERIKIVGLLASYPHNVRELAERVGIKEAVVTKHLNKLKKAKLIKEKKSDPIPTYHLNSDMLDDLNDFVLHGEKVADYRQRIIQIYTIGPKLREIPTDPTDRRIILEWFGEKFEVGKRYSQSRVNDIICRHYHKQETLRHILLDYAILQRVGDIYWRPA